MMRQVSCRNERTGDMAFGCRSIGGVLRPVRQPQISRGRGTGPLTGSLP
jgi:hypothetical protein